MRWVLAVVLLGLITIGFIACSAGVYRGKSDMALSSAAPAAEASASPAPGDADSGGDGAAGFDNSVQSGTLTAGEFDDVRDPQFFESFVRQLSESQRHTALLTAFADPPITLHVHDLAKMGLGGAVVEIENTVGQKPVTITTRTDGRAIVFPGWDHLPMDRPITVSVRAPGSSQTIKTSINTNDLNWQIAVPGVDSTKPTQLDLTFVIDCTGSMSDELEYLKVEVRGIARAIARQFPDVKQRYALVVYRDRTDQYVTKRYDFTSSLLTFIDRLGEQRADGGGDYPEAVHDALADAGRLSWSKGNVARVVFHIADAPPHDDKIEPALKATNVLREKGVAVYPIAASGVLHVAEFSMRTEAMLTGARYVFLTDDSGVGNTHAEPHFPYYDVQKLDKLIVRMVAMELTGQPIQANQADIIRRVRHKDIKPVVVAE